MTGSPDDRVLISGNLASPLRAIPIISNTARAAAAPSPGPQTGGHMEFRYAVSASEPVLAGHFPGFPIFPGVCLAECVHQAISAAFAGARAGVAEPELVAVDRARFLRPVFPGDDLSASVSMTEVPGGWRCSAELSVTVPDGESEVAAAFRLSYGSFSSAVPAGRQLFSIGKGRQDTCPADCGICDGAQAAARRSAGYGAGCPLGIAAIKQLLPHRYPMLLIDRVTQLCAGRSLTAVKAVTVNEPCYAALSDDADDHYPPMLLAESWCQAAGVLACLEQPNPDVLAGKVTLFGAITGMHLHRRVHPGECVTHRVRLLRSTAEAAVLAGEARTEAGPVMTIAQIIIALRPAQALTGARGRQA